MESPLAVHPGKGRREGRSKRSPRGHTADPASSKVGRFEVKPVQLQEKRGGMREDSDGTPGKNTWLLIL